jgi:hypothetical protein
VTERRLDWLVALTAAWMVGGAWVDVWSHHKSELESFFTPAHGVLYAGFLATAAVVVVASVRQEGGRFRLRAPDGYRLALVGIPLFLVGGVGDSVWHTVLGIEQDLDALLSPTHLILGFGSALMASGPAVAAWNRPRNASPDRLGEVELPALISLGLVVSVGVFFTSFANPFSLPVAAGDGLGALANLGVEGDAEVATTSALVEQALGVASILVVVAVLMSAVLPVALRWRMPLGGLTLVFALGIGASALPHEILAFVPAVLLAGLAADLLGRSLRPAVDRRSALVSFAFLVPVLLIGFYLATVQVTVGVAWPVALWSGSMVLAGAVGVGLAVLTIAASGQHRRPPQTTIA